LKKYWVQSVLGNYYCLPSFKIQGTVVEKIGIDLWKSLNADDYIFDTPGACGIRVVLRLLISNCFQQN